MNHFLVSSSFLFMMMHYFSGSLPLSLSPSLPLSSSPSLPLSKSFSLLLILSVYPSFFLALSDPPIPIPSFINLDNLYPRQATKALWSRRSKLGLLGSHINVQDGNWVYFDR
jgi:hypothetical protein